MFGRPQTTSRRSTTARIRSQPQLPIYREINKPHEQRGRPEVSIVIVTRNSIDKAKRAVESATTQEGNNEVLVIDDGSTNGTAEFLRRHFPGVRIVQSEKQQGYIAQRSRSGVLARGNIIISIDDDAEFIDSKVTNEALAMFNDPRIGAVSIPHLNCYKDGRQTPVAPCAPDTQNCYVIKTFIGTAYAVRRDLFISLDGFQNFLFHWGEESEYCQRLLGAGYVVRRGTRNGVYHYPEGIGKYTPANLRYAYRNRILTLWFNAPMAYFIPLFLSCWIMSIRNAFRLSNSARISLAGTAIGTYDLLRCWKLRKPISMRQFKLWLRIRKQGLIPLPEIVDLLPPAKVVPPVSEVDAEVRS